MWSERRLDNTSERKSLAGMQGSVFLFDQPAMKNHSEDRFRVIKKYIYEDSINFDIINFAE